MENTDEKVCRNANEVICASVSLQIRLRNALHKTNPKDARPGVPLGVELAALIDKEKNLHHLTPRQIRCLHVPHGEVLAVQDGYMLMAESTKRFPQHRGGGKTRYHRDSWSLWKLPSREEENQGQAPENGAKRAHGMWRWSGVMDKPLHAIGMCLEDDVLVVAQNLLVLLAWSIKSADG